MKKVLLNGFILLVFFGGILLLLNQVDWMKVFRVEKVTKQTEQKIGDLFLEFFKEDDREIEDSLIVNSVQLLTKRICEKNEIDLSTIKVHILKNEDVNAFAIPGGHLIIYSGLIAQADNEQELCGVIGHELAHIQLDHIMQKLIREVGLNALISISTGGSGTETIKNIGKLLSSTAFDRALEKEADLTSVNYLANAQIDPEGLANFLKKMAEKDKKKNNYFTWLSTHPDSKERADYILEEKKKQKIRNVPVLAPGQWDLLVEAVK